MAKTPSREDLDAVKVSFERFGRAGFRILLPSPAPEKVLMGRLSGGWYLAPEGHSMIGIDFAPAYRIDHDPLPIIRKFPYVHCLGTSIFVDTGMAREDYHFAFTAAERDSSENKMRGREYTGIPSKLLIEIGAAQESR